jgi:hypothetical protein
MGSRWGAAATWSIWILPSIVAEQVSAPGKGRWSRKSLEASVEYTDSRQGDPYEFDPGGGEDH